MPLKPHLKRHLLLILLILTLLPHNQAQEGGEAPISVGAQVTAIEEGETAEITCSTTQNETLLWFVRSNATENEIPEDSSLRVFANITTGLLTIQAARLNDSGKYLCQTVSGTHSITTELHVYNMPTYIMEGMIILGVILALLVIFAVFSLHDLVKSRKQSKQDKAKREAKMMQPNMDPETRPVTVVL